jgi:ABC-type dipeptide/oligopeptide/nickel transport system ATPase component
MTKKQHAVTVDRRPDVAPPVVVAVVGPPGCGKTTLIRSLVKRYTRQDLKEIRGTITVVTGKNRRLTFIECENDMNAMLDCGKIADLILLMVDASFGFEMETFEFLNVSWLRLHGAPTFKEETPSLCPPQRNLPQWDLLGAHRRTHSAHHTVHSAHAHFRTQPAWPLRRKRFTLLHNLACGRSLFGEEPPAVELLTIYPTAV